MAGNQTMKMRELASRVLALAKHPRIPQIDTPPNTRIACTAILLRSTVTSPIQNTVDVLSTHQELEVLYIRRAINRGDPWSGHVAFPGGKRDPGETSKETVVREVMEEIGLDLNTGFSHIATLDPTILRGKRLALCPFVFLQTDTRDIVLNPSPDEVDEVVWVPLRRLCSAYVRLHSLEDLHFSFNTAPNTSVFQHLIHRWPVFPTIRLLTGSNEFLLWGLTLRTTSELLTLLGHSALEAQLRSRKTKLLLRLWYKLRTRNAPSNTSSQSKL